MSASTNIEWTDSTWNPVRGCTPVSEGCRNCYAARVAARFSGPGLPYEGLAHNTSSGPRWTGAVRLVDEHLTDPLRWRKPRRIFVNSMSDLFHEQLSDREIDQVFGVMLANHLLDGPAGKHTFQVLTKRPARMRNYFSPRTYAGVSVAAHLIQRWADAVDGHVSMSDPDILFSEYAWGRCVRTVPAAGEKWAQTPWAEAPWPLPNVWLGVSIEGGREADARINDLRQTPAAVRYLSCEPLLGDLGEIDLDRIHWVIAGGESGPSARPMHPDWVRSLRDHCVAAGVPFFFKQWGEWGEVGYTPTHPRPSVVMFDGRHVPFTQDAMGAADREKRLERATTTYRVGKAAAGRELDGRTWDQFPEVRP